MCSNIASFLKQQCDKCVMELFNSAEVSTSMALRANYQLPKRLSRELKTVRLMIEIYCKDEHNCKVLCQPCTELLNYAEIRLENCRFQADKPTCGNCPVHCYRKSKAREIKEVMRYAGPKMGYKHPVLAIHHILDSRRKVPTTQL